MASEQQGMSKCPECGKPFYGGGGTELCFACWLLENPPDNSISQAPSNTGAGGWDYYRQPNIIVAMPRSDVTDYLSGCPRSRAIWFDVLHNSATPNGNGIGIVRSFQQYHMSRGWSDIGYHFVITTDGMIYLGRNLAHQGAHAFAEGNRGSMGYCLVGNFSGSGGLPSKEQIDSAGFLAQALGGVFKYDRHTGHRWTADPNIPSHATSCPGTNVSLGMVQGWTKKETTASPQPKPREDDMQTWEYFGVTKAVKIDCYRAKADYHVTTDGATQNLMFTLQGKDGGQAISTNSQDIKTDIQHDHNLQDILKQDRFKSLAGSYKLTVSCSIPINISIREVPK